MTRRVYVLLFRGINVGGSKIVRMDALRKLLADSGFDDVATYIQSGNVVLTSDKGPGEVIDLVEKVFAESFGFTSRLTVRTSEDWRRMIEENPFPEAVEDGRRVHAVLLDATPAADAVGALERLATTEEIEARDGVLYLHTPDGFGRSKVAESLDKVLRVPLTARNWNTVLKLQEMIEGLKQA
jgi:uncharacterized protein (DUF1697 family)